MMALGGVSAASAGDGLNVSGTDLVVDQVGYNKNMKHMSNTPLAGTFALPAPSAPTSPFRATGLRRQLQRLRHLRHLGGPAPPGPSPR